MHATSKLTHFGSKTKGGFAYLPVHERQGVRVIIKARTGHRMTEMKNVLQKSKSLNCHFFEKVFRKKL